MPLLDLDKITNGLPTIWDSYLRSWDRTLRSANRPETTRYNLCVPKITSAQVKRHADTRAARAGGVSRSRPACGPATRRVAS